MASDGQATSLSSGGYVKRPLSKINMVGKNVLWGGSGSVGMLQKASNIFEHPDIKMKGISDPVLRLKILQGLFGIRKAELERHRGLYDRYGLEFEQRGAQVADLLIAGYDGVGKNLIWHIDADCRDEFVDALDYGCTGNGDTFAYASLKNYHTKDLPIEKGALLAYRVIRDAIDVNAFGLGEPISVFALSKEGISEYKKEQIDGLRDTYNLWLSMEQDIFKGLQAKPKL